MKLRNDRIRLTPLKTRALEQPPPKRGSTEPRWAPKPTARASAGPLTDHVTPPKLSDYLRATTSVGATRTSSAADSTEAYKALIRADLQTAYGRDATQADFDYWLPKLQGPCDSSFVTSGQLSGTEYWHRRLLGWQAGGPDLATAGPYAGSPDAHGPVPSATEVVPGVPPGGAFDASGASPALLDAFRRLIDADLMMAYGRNATEADHAYWLPKLLGPCDSGFVTSGQLSGTEYWHRRLLGWQAGGPDTARFGPYAGGPEARGQVPAFTELIGALPE